MTGAEITQHLADARAWIARQALGFAPKDGSLREDLVQEGLLAASIALQSWRPGEAGWIEWIKRPVRHAMLNYLRRNRPAGVSGVTRTEAAREAGVRALSMDAGHVANRQERGNYAGGEGGAFSRGEYTLHEIIGINVEMPDSLAFDLLADLVSELPQRERRVIRLRFVEGLTLEQTGARVGGITRERVRQIEAKALARLKARFARRGGGHA